ncbi:hypothetical protein AXF42_Ash008964 [Apostasia shenzhenica]|uniref:Uncharacterized protein n=1 Tax=Apostasia shenzhenica TaxID=1088818 RepID=A0A2I0AT23_9ASPA|nr:hypothetical protein AXF42_Ash008964 [Apostasia shenzhenica]
MIYLQRNKARIKIEPAREEEHSKLVARDGKGWPATEMEQGAKASCEQRFFKTRVVGVNGTGSSPREGAGARAERACASGEKGRKRREGAQAASVARAASWGHERRPGTGEQGARERNGTGERLAKGAARAVGTGPAARAASNGTGTNGGQRRARRPTAPSKLRERRTSGASTNGGRRRAAAANGSSCKQGAAEAASKGRLELQIGRGASRTNGGRRRERGIERLTGGQMG